MILPITISSCMPSHNCSLLAYHQDGVHILQEDGWSRRVTKRTGVLRVRRAAGGPPILNGQYVLVRSLGAGAYGRVKLVLNLQDMQLYAVKAISKRSLLGNRHGATMSSGRQP